MRTGIVELLSALRDIVMITFIAPVRNGRPRPSKWPAGLPVIGAAALVVYCLLGVAAIFAGPLRRSSELVIAQPLSEFQLPELAIPLLLCGVVLSMALAHTAAIRTRWWARLAIIVVGVTVLLSLSGRILIEQPWAIWVSAVIYLALCVFMLVRSRRQFVWWEFATVTVLISAALFFPWIVGSPLHDIRVTVLPLTLANVEVLALPALVVAGVAPTQVIVTAAAATSSRPLHRGLFWLVFAVGVSWLAIETWRGLQGNLTPAFAGSLPELAGVAAGVWIWLARARQPAPLPPGEYPGLWARWLYPLAIAIVGFQLVAVPVSTVTGDLRMFGGELVADPWNIALNAYLANYGPVLWRGAIGVVLLLVCWKISASGRSAEASLLGAVSVSFLLQTLGSLPGQAWLLENSPRGMALIAAVIALTAVGIYALRRQLMRSSAASALFVVLLAALYPYRDVLSDPASAALGFSAQLLILFGLTWRVLTGADFRERSTKLLPYASRVLFFIANFLFAVTVLAFMALSRASGTVFDPANASETGAWTLGEPLLTVGLVAGVWLTLRPGPTRSTEESGSADDNAGRPQTQPIPQPPLGYAVKSLPLSPSPGTVDPPPAGES